VYSSRGGGGLVLSTPTMVIVSMVLLILGLVIGGFLSTCYNNGCGQVMNSGNAGISWLTQ